MFHLIFSYGINIFSSTVSITLVDIPLFSPPIIINDGLLNAVSNISFESSSLDKAYTLYPLSFKEKIKSLTLSEY